MSHSLPAQIPPPSTTSALSSPKRRRRGLTPPTERDLHISKLVKIQLREQWEVAQDHQIDKSRVSQIINARRPNNLEPGTCNSLSSSPSRHEREILDTNSPTTTPETTYEKSPKSRSSEMSASQSSPLTPVRDRTTANSSTPPTPTNQSAPRTNLKPQVFPHFFTIAKLSR
jgi:hypothetical protein